MFCMYRQFVSPERAARTIVLGVAVVADIDDVAAWLGATPGQSAGVTGSRVQRNQIREGKGLHVVYTAIFDMAKNHIEVLNC